MDAAQLAALLSTGGPWSIVAILCGVVVKLYGDKERIQSERLEDTKESLASVSAAVKTIEAVLPVLTHTGKR